MFPAINIPSFFFPAASNCQFFRWIFPQTYQRYMFQDLSGFWLGAWVGMVKIHVRIYACIQYTCIYIYILYTMMPSWKLSTQVGFGSMVVSLLGLILIFLWTNWMFEKNQACMKNYPFWWDQTWCQCMVIYRYLPYTRAWFMGWY